LIIHIRVTGIILIVRAVSLPGERSMVALPFQLVGTLDPVSASVLVTVKVLALPDGTSIVNSLLPDGIETRIALIPWPVTDKPSEPKLGDQVIPAKAFVLKNPSILSTQFRFE